MKCDFSAVFAVVSLILFGASMTFAFFSDFERAWITMLCVFGFYCLAHSARGDDNDC